MLKKSINIKIAESEIEWQKYKYGKIGVRESMGLLYVALKRRLKIKIYRTIRTIQPYVKRTSFKSSYDNKKENIVVSLTSTEGRIKSIFPTLYSLMAQTNKPDLIILWLGKNMKFPQKIISQIKSMGVLVKFREDYGPNTKYYYVFDKYKNDVVITVDDDIIYHKNMIDELYETFLKHPNSVIARRTHKMRFNSERKIMKYKDWIWEYRDSDVPSYDLLATGVGGVLYPPRVMALECWENRDFLKICPKADDVWLKFCELSNGIKVCAVKNSKFHYDVINRRSQKTNLETENVDQGRNDERIRACAEYFGMSSDLCERVLT